MPTVTIFNANPLAAFMQVNNGPQFSVAGAYMPSWTPQSPTSGGPSWSNTGPAQNAFGPGFNNLGVMPAGAMQPSIITLNLPKDMQWTSLQLYVFFGINGDLRCVVLNEGQLVPQ